MNLLHTWFSLVLGPSDGVVSYLYGDQLGSVSAVADASGNQVSTTLFEFYDALGAMTLADSTSFEDY